MNRFISATTVALLASNLVSAQTFTDCDPTKKGCADDQAFASLGSSITADFRNGEDALKEYFTVAVGTTLSYDKDKGAVFTVATDMDAPTITSKYYIFGGKVEVIAQAAPGTGVCSSVVLQSDDLDEIDWEWLGTYPNEVQTNYFGKGSTVTYDRGGKSTVQDATSKMHKYTIEMIENQVTWSIDDVVVRTLTPATAPKDYPNFPSTPMQIKIGLWDAGGKNQSEGTVQWAGGYTDFSGGSFKGYYEQVTITDYCGGTSACTKKAGAYRYSDRSGDWGSIAIVDATNSSSDSSDSSSSSSSSSTAKGSSASDSTSSTMSSSSTMSTAVSASATPSGTSNGTTQTSSRPTSTPSITPSSADKVAFGFVNFGVAALAVLIGFAL